MCIERKVVPVMKYIVLDKKYNLEKENEDTYFIVNEMNETIGKINKMTYQLINELNKKKNLEDVCLFFLDEIKKSYEYVRRNMIKSIQFLLANKILIEVEE